MEALIEGIAEEEETIYILVAVTINIFHPYSIFEALFGSSVSHLQFFWRSVDLEINVFYQDAGISQEIDTRLSLKINEYVKELKNVQEIKRLLKLYVRHDLFNNRDLPDIRNRRYFPTISTIRAHIVSARRKMQLSLIDQEALIEKNSYMEARRSFHQNILQTKKYRSN